MLLEGEGDTPWIQRRLKIYVSPEFKKQMGVFFILHDGHDANFSEKSVEENEFFKCWTIMADVRLHFST